ncbi:MAG: ABC transporter permease [Candidatus Aquicultor sp.]
MGTISVLFKKDLLEQVRSKKLLILAIIFLFLAMVSPISAKLLPQLVKNLTSQGGITIKIPEPTFNDAITQFVKNASQLVIFLLIFVVAGAVADEKVRKTLEMVLVKPVSRQSFILSKFLAYFSTVTVFYLVGVVVFYLYTVLLFTSFGFVNFFIVAVLTLAYLLLILSITIAASTLVKSTAVAGVIGLFSSFVFGSILSAFSRIADYSPGYVLSRYPDLLQKGWDSAFLSPTIVTVVLVAVSIILAVVVFRGQEIER